MPLSDEDSQLKPESWWGRGAGGAVGVGPQGRALSRPGCRFPAAWPLRMTQCSPQRQGKGRKVHLYPQAGRACPTCLPPSCRSGETLSGPLCFALLTPSSRPVPAANISRPYTVDYPSLTTTRVCWLGSDPLPAMPPWIVMYPVSG